ncbi:MAG TPA: ATP-binding protein [Xanthomonadales bacterium]|nr:ATP-binding protein [Xanthomonadales bacterium]
MPILVSFSGGKDAAWTLHRLQQSSHYRPIGLLTTLEDGAQVALHGLRREVIAAQARALGLPLLEAPMPDRADNLAYEGAFATALELARLRWPGLAHIAFGDIFLADIKAYRDQVCGRLGWTAVYPLFGADSRSLADAMIAAGLKARICCIDSERLSADFLARQFNRSLLDQLPPDIDPCGEYGEFHTCVFDGPMFQHPIAIERGASSLYRNRFLRADFRLPASD